MMSSQESTINEKIVSEIKKFENKKGKFQLNFLVSDDATSNNMFEFLKLNNLDCFKYINQDEMNLKSECYKNLLKSKINKKIKLFYLPYLEFLFLS